MALFVWYNVEIQEGLLAGTRNYSESEKYLTRRALCCLYQPSARPLCFYDSGCCSEQARETLPNYKIITFLYSMQSMKQKYFLLVATMLVLSEYENKFETFCSLDSIYGLNCVRIPRYRSTLFNKRLITVTCLFNILH